MADNFTEHWSLTGQIAGWDPRRIPTNSQQHMTEQMADSGGQAGFRPEIEAARDRRRATLEAFVVAACLLAAVVAGTLGVWVSYSQTVRDNFRRHLIEFAQAVAQQVDTDVHARIRQPGQIDSPDYLKAVAPLRRLRLGVPGIKYVYTLVRADDGTIRFILDGADPGDNDGDGVEDRSGVWELCKNKQQAVQIAVGRRGVPGRPSATDEPYTDPWGTFMTGYAPFYDASGRQAGAVGVDMDAGVYVARIRTARDRALLGLLPAGVLIVGLSLVFYRIRLRGLGATREVARAAREAEESARVLAKQKQRLRNVIDGTGVGTWEWNLETGVVFINDRWAAMMGYTLEELGTVTVESWKALLHPDDMESVVERLEASFAEMTRVYETDFRMRHCQGHWVWITTRGAVIERTPDGTPLRMAGTHLDITARKETHLALKDSESKFRGLFELSPVGIALNDLRTGQFLQVNDALLAPTGYSREELLALTLLGHHAGLLRRARAEPARLHGKVRPLRPLREGVHPQGRHAATRCS